MKRYIIIIFFLVVGIWLIVRGCSNDGMNRHLYYIGRDSTWAPDGFLGKERNVVGFTNEMLAEIAKRENMRFEFVEIGHNELLPELEHEDIDAVFSTLSPNIANEEKFLFSEVFYPLGPVLAVPIASAASSLSDMNGKIVGVQTGMLQSYQIYEFPNLIIVPYTNILKALEDLEKNVIDGVILDFLHGYAYIQGYYSHTLRIATPPLSDRGWRLVALRNKNSGLFIDHFNEGLQLMKEDGTYDNLIQKWDLFQVK